MSHHDLTDVEFINALKGADFGPPPLAGSIVQDLHRRFARAMQATSQERRQIGLLMGALSSAVTYNDRALLIALVAAGSTWAAATTDSARTAEWAAVAAAAGWGGGFSNE